MAENLFILLRVAPSQKKLITDAARQRGQTITSFVLGSAVEQAHKAKTGSVLSFLKSQSATAARGGKALESSRAVGRGYRAAGWRVAEHLAGRREWRKPIAELEKLVADDASIDAWLKRHLPQALNTKLIPQHRRDDFIDGIERAIRRRGKDWTKVYTVRLPAEPKKVR